MRGRNNVGRAVPTDPTLLRYASAITEQKKCLELSSKKFDRFQTLRNNMQQGVQTDATCNIQQCWELLANNVNVASVCTGLNFKLCERNLACVEAGPRIAKLNEILWCCYHSNGTPLLQVLNR